MMDLHLNISLVSVLCCHEQGWVLLRTHSDDRQLLVRVAVEKLVGDLQSSNLTSGPTLQITISTSDTRLGALLPWGILRANAKVILEHL